MAFDVWKDFYILYSPERKGGCTQWKSLTKEAEIVNLKQDDKAGFWEISVLKYNYGLFILQHKRERKPIHF